MKCPHCRTDFHDEAHTIGMGTDAEDSWAIERRVSSACKKIILEFGRVSQQFSALASKYGGGRVHGGYLFRPKVAGRGPCPPEVPPPLAQDYTEATLVLADSPKASAALSRRCLQSVLREAAKVKHESLAGEIQQVLDAGHLPSHLAEAVDAIRNIGNFAAHPIKSEHTGEIVAVEPAEAEWNLDVLESLFDFFYVQPALTAAKRARLDAKLGASGKPPTKQPEA